MKNDTATKAPELTQSEQIAKENEILKDMPELTPAKALSTRKINEIMAISAKITKVTPDGSVEFDANNIESTLPVLDALADVDDFAISIAKEPEALRGWLGTNRYSKLSMILSRYARAVGN